MSAQYEDLLNDRNISWVAEHTTDFRLDPGNYNWDSYEILNDVTIMQLSDPPTDFGVSKFQDLDRFFSQKFWGDILENAYAIYEDEQLEMPLAKEKMLQLLTSVDTVTFFDPDTFEEKVMIVSNEIGYGDIAAFRVRQVFYYDKTKKFFGSRLLAVAPVVQNRNMAVDFLDESQPLFWLKMQPPKNAEKLTAKDVAYSIQTVMGSIAPGLQDFVPKRGRIDFLQLIVNEVSEPSRPVLDNDFHPIPPASLQGHVIVTDTVVTYTPDTYEERIEIVQRNVIKDVESISFVQQWFFDGAKNLLFNRVVAIAPRIAVKDLEGNIQYNQVLFYMVNK